MQMHSVVDNSMAGLVGHTCFGLPAATALLLLGASLLSPALAEPDPEPEATPDADAFLGCWGRCEGLVRFLHPTWTLPSSSSSSSSASSFASFSTLLSSFYKRSLSCRSESSNKSL